MAEADGRILIDIEGDSSDLQDALNDVEKQSTRLGDVFKATFLSDLLVTGLDRLADGARSLASGMVDAAAEVKAQESQFAQTFGVLADSAEEAIGRVAEQSDILDSRLSTVGTRIYAFARSSGGDTAESMALMEQALTATADAAAYYDRSLEETAEQLQSFLKGNYENDAALGLSATETTRNAAAMALFGQKFNELTEIQKQQTLLQMVVDAQELSGAMGQAAREADGWENVQGNLTEAWRQFMAVVGSPALSAAVPLIQSVTAGVRDMTEALQGGGIDAAFQAAADGAGQLLSRIAQGAAQVLPQMAQAGASLLSGLISGIAQQLPEVSGQWLALLTGLFDLLSGSLPDLLAQGALLLETLVRGVVEAVPRYIGDAAAFFDAFVGFVADNLPSVLRAGTDVLFSLLGGILDAIPEMAAKLPLVIRSITSTIREHLPEIVSAGFGLLVRFAAGILDAVPELVASLPVVVAAILGGLGEAVAGVVGIGADLVRGLWEGISNMVGWIAEKLRGFGDSVLGALKDFFGIASPSTLLRDTVGVMLARGVGDGINAGADYAVRAAADMGGAITDELEAVTARALQEQEALSGLDLGLRAGAAASDLSSQLRAAVEAESLRFSGALTVAGNAAGDARRAEAASRAVHAASAAAMLGGAGAEREIVLLLNGIEVARALVPDIRAVEDQSPRIVSD